MDYYIKKQYMIKEIIAYLNQNEKVELNNLYFIIYNKFGFSKRIINEYLQMLEKENIIKFENDNIILLDKNKLNLCLVV